MPCDDARIIQIQTDLATLTATVHRHMETETPLMDQIQRDISGIQKGTADILAFWVAAEGGFKVLKWIGVLAKWVTVVSAAIGIVAAVWNYLNGR